MLYLGLPIKNIWRLKLALIEWGILLGDLLFIGLWVEFMVLVMNFKALEMAYLRDHLLLFFMAQPLILIEDGLSEWRCCHSCSQQGHLSWIPFVTKGGRLTGHPCEGSRTLELVFPSLHTLVLNILNLVIFQTCGKRYLVLWTKLMGLASS